MKTTCAGKSAASSSRRRPRALLSVVSSALRPMRFGKQQVASDKASTTGILDDNGNLDVETRHCRVSFFGTNTLVCWCPSQRRQARVSACVTQSSVWNSSGNKTARLQPQTKASAFGAIAGRSRSMSETAPDIEFASFPGVYGLQETLSMASEFLRRMCQLF